MSVNWFVSETSMKPKLCIRLQDMNLDVTGRDLAETCETSKVEDPEKETVDSRSQVELEEDGGDSRRQSWMEWPMVH